MKVLSLLFFLHSPKPPHDETSPNISKTASVTPGWKFLFVFGSFMKSLFLFISALFLSIS